MFVTYSKRLKDANGKTYINVSKHNQPYGMMWTWCNTKSDQHPWHGKKTETGEHFSSFGNGCKHTACKDVIDWMNKL